MPHIVLLEKLRRSKIQLPEGLSECVRRLAYAEKWLILGVVIGISSSCLALFFYFLLIFFAGIAAWILGVVDNPLSWNVSDFSLAALSSGDRWFIVLIVGLGALVSGFLVYRFEPLAEGPGANAAIRAYHRGAVFRTRLPLVKAMASALLIGFGGSGGVQGPSIQIGAGTGSAISRLLRLSFEDRRLAIVAGMAGSLAAIFRSPIGSALFAVEVLYKRDIESEALVPAVISSITSYTFSAYIVGIKGLFPTIPVDANILFTYQSLLTYMLLGFISAGIALFYIKVYEGIRRLFARIHVGRYRWVKPAIGGVVTGLIGFMAPMILGTGSLFIAKFLDGSINGRINLNVLGLGLEASLLLLVLLKIIGTSFSIGSGGSGGLFAPSIFVGALLGYLFGHIFATPLSGIPPYVYAYMGMASLFGAATKTPLATSIMVAEMSGSYILAIPALASSIVASELIGEHSLYHAQLTRRVQPKLTSLRVLLDVVTAHRDVAELKVEDIVDTEYEAVKINEPCSKAIEVFVKGKQRFIPVVDEGEQVIGVIDPGVLRRVMEQGDLSMPVSLLKLNIAPTVGLSDSLHHVIEEMIRFGVDYAIAVDDAGKYVGVVLAEDIAVAIAYYVAGLSEDEEE